MGSIRAAQRAWGCSYYAAKKRLRRGETPGPKGGPEFPDIRHFPEDAESTWDALQAYQAEALRWERQQSTATVRLPDKGVVGIALRGDWHLGNQHTDYATFLRHRDLIRDTPGLYSVELGDLIDGFIQPSKLSGQHEALARVKIQRHLVWDTIKQLSGKVLALASGQHDHWGVFQADFEPVEWCAADNKVPYLGHGGLLTVEVGEQSYRFHLRHRYRYNSSTNQTHSIKQFWRFDGDSHIGVHADRHTPVVEHLLWKGEHRIAARPGSYKPTDDFMESYGYPRGEPIMPCVLLWPDKWRIDTIWDLDDAPDGLSRLRK